MEHKHNCNCGHQHTEDLCSCNHETCKCHNCDEKITLNDMEKSVLLEFLHTPYLPICRFIMASSKEEEARFTALEPVYINKKSDNMETVKEVGKLLTGMEDKGLLTLDYDMPLNGFDYSLYFNSDLYDYFKETIELGKNKPNFLCDLAEIETGSMALTDFGEKMAHKISEE